MVNPSIAPSARLTRVLLVDGQPVFLSGLAALLDSQPTLTVCGQALGQAEALALLRSAQPDLVISGISLRDGGGLDLTERVRKLQPSTTVLIISSADELTYAERALRSGAAGFVSKVEGEELLLRAVQTVLGGDIHLSPRAASAVLAPMMGRGRPSASATKEGHEALTNRELQVFRLIGAGMSTREIAASLSLSVKTIASHRASIKRRLGIRHSTELVRRATRWVIDREASDD
jgi:DNA-binding NarL/FixJ family response regulator